MILLSKYGVMRDFHPPLTNYIYTRALTNGTIFYIWQLSRSVVLHDPHGKTLARVARPEGSTLSGVLCIVQYTFRIDSLNYIESMEQVQEFAIGFKQNEIQ